MDGVGSDLQTKYQKLALEYAKVRAQVGVLKKAVVDEQTKNSDLKDLLREREQSLRKDEQEMDSLTFRNQQLTKRVTVLQDELDAMGKLKKSKGKLTESSIGSNNEVMGEELHKTITENAKLSSMLHDKEEAHRQDIEHLTQRIEQLEYELRMQQEQHKRTVSKLEVEKASALASAALPAPSGTPSSTSTRVDQRIEALQKSNAELTAHAKELNSQRLQLTSQLEDATRVIRTHLPFVDSNDRDLNELNVPQYNRVQHADVLRIVNQAGSCVEELTRALERYHQNLQTRFAVDRDSLSPLKSKFAEHLQDGGRLLHHLRRGFSDFQDGLQGDSCTLDTIPSLAAFSKPLRSYSLYLQKLQPYCQLSIEEDCILHGRGEDYIIICHNLVSWCAQLSGQMTTVSGYVHLLAGQSKRQSQHSFESQDRLLKELLKSVIKLKFVFEGLQIAYLSKFEVECHLKPENTLAEQAGESIASSMQSATENTEKLAKLLEALFSQLGEFGRQVHPTVTAFRSRAAHYLASLDQEEPPSVPYEEALHVKLEVQCQDENCKALMSQLQATLEQAAQAERDREHWQQEYHLLLLHQENNEGNVKNSSGTEAKDSESGKSTTITNLLGKLSSPFITPPEVEAREDKVKDYFRSRIYELVARSQTSEARATTLLSECAVLKTRLENAVQSQRICEDRALELAEELASTTQGYDTQLAVMSEHLANMNEKLALQKDTIDHLKFQSKASKKGKQK